MNVRDRLEEIQRFKLSPDENGELQGDPAISGATEAASHTLLNHYVTEEELRACTTCNACVEACPVNIDPLRPIIEMRRFLVLEESKMPEEWAGMFTNVENNGAPWAFPAANRADWLNSVEES
jgi:Fe-S oxidoreductase